MSATTNTPAVRLCHARIRAGFNSKSDAARALGVSTSTYRAWENGQNGVSIWHARRAAEVFGIRWEWLLSGEGDMVDMADFAVANNVSATSPLPAPELQDDTIVHAQDQIEVYLGGTGGVVMRAINASLGGDEDQIITIRPENVDAVVAAMLRVKGEDQR